MSEFKGTPGPWEIDGVEIRASALHPMDRICDMAPGFSAEDAQLIASAPDLLSALLAITNSGPDAIPIKEAFEMAHRAIERALAP